MLHRLSYASGITYDILPMSVPTDRLAHLRAKAVKAAGSMSIKPFPFMEIEDFLPGWAKARLALDPILALRYTHMHG